ncbi:HAD family hydrolase [Streptomyces sp. NPDC001177]
MALLFDPVVGQAPYAVIFDCDGTLADTEPLAHEVWKSLLAPYGYAVTEEDMQSCLGHSYPSVHGHFAGRIPVLPSHENLWPAMSAAMLQLIGTRLRPFDDTVSVARHLHAAGIQVALATSSPRTRMEATLNALGLRALFTTAVAGDEVAEGKPAPDVFLVAAARLGRSPHECLAIEDSTVGVAAARTAGMRVVAIDRDTGQDLSAADLVVPQLTIAALNTWITAHHV